MSFPSDDADLLDLLIADGDPLGSVAEIGLAVRNGEVTFPMVMKALYYQYPQWSRSASPPRPTTGGSACSACSVFTSH